MLNAVLSLPAAAGEDSLLAKTFGVRSSEFRYDPNSQLKLISATGLSRWNSFPTPVQTVLLLE